MDELSLTRMAKELLEINEEIARHFKQPRKTTIRDFRLKTFDQLWGSTTGAFQGIGGSAMTWQRTYVFLPYNTEDEDAIVYFGGRFGYRVPVTPMFLSDVDDGIIEGVGAHERYFKQVV